LSAWVGQSQPRKFQSRARNSKNTIFFVGYFRKESGRFTAGWWFGTWILWLSFSWGFHHPSWPNHIFFSRLKPPTRYIIIYNPIKPPLNHHQATIKPPLNHHKTTIGCLTWQHIIGYDESDDKRVFEVRSAYIEPFPNEPWRAGGGQTCGRLHSVWKIGIL
jgi:hypothetical protein